MKDLEGMITRKLSIAEYDALPQSEREDPNVIYVVGDNDNVKEKYVIYIEGDVNDADYILAKTECSPDEFFNTIQYIVAFMLHELPIDRKYKWNLRKLGASSMEDVWVKSPTGDYYITDDINFPTEPSYCEDAHTITEIRVEYWRGTTGEKINNSYFDSIDWHDRLTINKEE